MHKVLREAVVASKHWELELWCGDKPWKGKKPHRFTDMIKAVKAYEIEERFMKQGGGDSTCYDRVTLVEVTDGGD